jgi:hypothetical protein
MNQPTISGAAALAAEKQLQAMRAWQQARGVTHAAREALRQAEREEQAAGERLDIATAEFNRAIGGATPVDEMQAFRGAMIQKAAARADAEAGGGAV